MGFSGGLLGTQQRVLGPSLSPVRSKLNKELQPLFYFLSDSNLLRRLLLLTF